MMILYNVMLVLHFVGLASLLGGVIVQIKAPDKGVNRAMFDGALLQILTGVIMVGLAESGSLEDEQLNMAKISVKLAIVIVIAVLAFIGRKKKPPQVGLWAIIGALALLNVIIAVFW